MGHTEAITTGSLAGHNAVRWLAVQNDRQETEKSATGGAPDNVIARHRHGLLQLPRETAVGDLIAYANERIVTEDGLRNRYTFAGDEYFQRMQQRGLYTVNDDLIRQRVEDAGLMGIYDRKIV
jgi:hypothetical protein